MTEPVPSIEKKITDELILRTIPCYLGDGKIEMKFVLLDTTHEGQATAASIYYKEGIGIVPRFDMNLDTQLDSIAPQLAQEFEDIYGIKLDLKTKEKLKTSVRNIHNSYKKLEQSCNII